MQLVYYSLSDLETAQRMERGDQGRAEQVSKQGLALRELGMEQG